MGSILYGLANQRREASIVIVTVIVFVGWVISVCLHEFGHAIVAYWGGDKTVKDKGYLTLNPLKYTDVSLSLVLPIIFLLLGGIPLPGGAVYINHSLLRNRGWESAMSAAGPAMTLLVAVLLSMPFRWGVMPHFESFSLTTQDQVWLAIAFLALLEVAGAVLNLLPIPSLDGFGIIEPWLPPRIQQQFRKYSRYGFLALFALLWFVPAANLAFWNFVDLVSQQLGIPTELARLGHYVFQQWAWLPLVVLIVTLIIARRLHPQPQKRMTSNEPIDLKQASADYNQALEVEPENAQILCDRGFTQYNLKQYTAAINAYERAAYLQPTLWQAWYLKGLALMRLQEYERAIRSYEQALYLCAGSAQTWIAKGSALLQLQDFQGAIAAYDQALILEPNNATAVYNKACTFTLQGQISAALEALAKAFALDPNLCQELAATDPDLDGLRSEAEFQELTNFAEFPIRLHGGDG